MRTPERNCYAQAGLSQMPHILGLVDRNPYSPTFGCFDRSYWHYKTMPFPSGMYQEFVLPLALVHRYSFPGGEHYYQQGRLREIVAGGIRFAETSAHSDGSCDDYFPYERALGAVSFSLYAMTESYQILGFNEPDMRAFFAKRGRWLMDYQESGRLSNHQALCLLALYNVHMITGDDAFLEGVRHRIDVLMDWQSDEGWFPEYEGCDPGYLSGTIDFLTKYLRKSADQSVAEPIRAAIRFAAQCVHPDGSYGGEYGSRNTHAMFPTGFEMMAAELPEAAYVADRYLAGMADDMRVHFDDDRMAAHLTYNYLHAYLAHEERARRTQFEPAHGTRYWEESRLYFRRTAGRYAVVAASKGGTVRVYDDEKLIYGDNGLIAKLSDGTTVVTHMVADNEVTADDDNVEIAGRFSNVGRKLATPLTQAIFHVGMLVLGRLWSNGVRMLLQKVLITGKDFTEITYRRRIEFGDTTKIIDEITLPDEDVTVEKLSAGADHTSIYIAVSQSFQRSMLREWVDLSEYVDELNRERHVRIEREVG